MANDGGGAGIGDEASGEGRPTQRSPGPRLAKLMARFWSALSFASWLAGGPPNPDVGPGKGAP